MWNRMRSPLKLNERDYKLIEFVKPHEILYNGHLGTHSSDERATLWKEICQKMDESFKLEKGDIDWRNRWHKIRLSFSHGRNRKGLEFLLPYVRDRQTKKSNVKPTRPVGRPRLVKEHQPEPHPIGVENVSPLVTANTNNENDLDLSLLNHDVIERHQSLFDVYYERDGSNGSNVQAQTPAQVPAQPLANRNVAPCLPISMGVPSDAYGDIAFGSLIAGELLRMEPDAKRELKRKISQMIFS